MPPSVRNLNPLYLRYKFPYNWRKWLRIAITVYALCLIYFVVTWIWPGKRQSSLLLPSPSPLPFSELFPQTQNAADQGESRTHFGYHAYARIPRIDRPQLHVLVMIPSKREDLCRTLLSSTILNYPPPTLIGYRFQDKGHELNEVSAKGNLHSAHNYLRTGFRVRDSDLVLIVGGENVAFHLPPEILVQRYHESIRRVDKEFGERHQVFKDTKPWDQWSKAKRVPRISQTVLMAIPDDCFFSTGNNVLTCPSNGSADTLQNSVLRSIIGPVKDVRAIFERAVQKLTNGQNDSPNPILDIFNLQQKSREATRDSSRSRPQGWLWPTPSIARHDNEFSLGLDNLSTLFYAISPSQPVVAAKRVKDLPDGIRSSRAPYPGASVSDITYQARSFLPLYDAFLDFPFQKDGSHEASVKNTWSALPLLQVSSTSSIPAIILSSEPQKLWYASHARALLRETIRRPQAPIYLGPDLPQNLTWDFRGGGSGYWTTTKNWLNFQDVCGDEHLGNQVFGDGKGAWGKEEGWETRERLWNFWGKRVIGESVVEGEDEDWKEGFPGERGNWEEVTAEYRPELRYRGDWEWPADGRGYLEGSL